MSMARKLKLKKTPDINIIAVSRFVDLDNYFSNRKVLGWKTVKGLTYVWDNGSIMLNSICGYKPFENKALIWKDGKVKEVVVDNEIRKIWEETYGTRLD